jgi:ABC-2 type transport system ATP-binding protein
LLEARNLSKTYPNGVRALAGLGLAVPDGHLCCLMGPNGAGKSTTINLFLDYIEPTDGVALVDGVNVHTDLLESRRRIAYIPEQVSLYGALSARQNIAFFAGLMGQRGVDYAACLRPVGLEQSVLARRVETFSKGMRQRLALAIALLKGARNLLLDEPTSGLDPKGASMFVDLLVRLRDEGYAILISSHDLYRITEISDTVAIMTNGRLCASLRGDEIDKTTINHTILSILEDHTRPHAGGHPLAVVAR